MIRLIREQVPQPTAGGGANADCQKNAFVNGLDEQSVTLHVSNAPCTARFDIPRDRLPNAELNDWFCVWFNCNGDQGELLSFAEGRCSNPGCQEQFSQQRCKEKAQQLADRIWNSPEVRNRKAEIMRSGLQGCGQQGALRILQRIKEEWTRELLTDCDSGRSATQGAATELLMRFYLADADNLEASEFLNPCARNYDLEEACEFIGENASITVAEKLGDEEGAIGDLCGNNEQPCCNGQSIRDLIDNIVNDECNRLRNEVPLTRPEVSAISSRIERKVLLEVENCLRSKPGSERWSDVLS